MDQIGRVVYRNVSDCLKGMSLHSLRGLIYSVGICLYTVLYCL